MPSEESQNEIERRYEETRKELQWYRERLLNMAEGGDKGSDEWDRYRTEMNEIARRQMRMARKLRSRATDADHTELRTCAECGDEIDPGKDDNVFAIVSESGEQLEIFACSYECAVRSLQPGTERGGGPVTSGDRLLHVDLCTGLGGWRGPFEESDRWTSVGIDIRDDLEADVVADVRRLPIDCSPTLLTMSPPCTPFSRFSMPWLDEPDPDMGLVRACLEAVDELDPDWWVLENVRGLKQYAGIQEDKRVGPYYLWGEFPPFDVALTDGGKMSVSGDRPEERAEIPFGLADSLRRSVEVFGL